MWTFSAIVTQFVWPIILRFLFHNAEPAQLPNYSNTQQQSNMSPSIILNESAMCSCVHYQGISAAWATPHRADVPTVSSEKHTKPQTNIDTPVTAGRCGQIELPLRAALPHYENNSTPSCLNAELCYSVWHKTLATGGYFKTGSCVRCKLFRWQVMSATEDSRGKVGNAD